MAHYLLTGAAGFIGARVAEMLLEQGHQVTGVDNLNDAYDVRLKEYRLKRLKGKSGFSFFQQDIGDFDQLKTLVKKQTATPKSEFEAVINLAARAGVRASVENPWLYYQTNLTGTLNLLEICRLQHIPKFILASTSSIYGAEAPLPTPEEAASDRPLQPYAASKKAAEVLAHSYHFLNGLDVSVLRYFTVYGPAGRPDMVMFRFVQWIKEGRPVRVNGDGNQSRGFTFLDDIALGTIAALKPLGYEIINLGGHETIRLNELVTMIETKTGETARVEYRPAHPADMRANWADVGKARRLLNWQPKTGLDQGVQSMVDWYLQERTWARLVATEA